MCAFLLGFVLPAQATSFTEYLPMSDSEYAQKRALKSLLTMPYFTDQNWHFRKVGVAGVTLEKMPNEEDYWQLTAKDRAGKSGLCLWVCCKIWRVMRNFTVLTSIVMAFRIWLSGEAFRETGWRLPRF